MKPKRFDQYWLYPEITGQLSLAIRDPEALAEVERLIARGNIGAIGKWLETADIPDEAVRLMLLGIDEDGYCPLLFDEIVMAIRSYGDMCGSSTYLLCRRVGRVFRHRVYQDGFGETLDTFDADAPMSRRDVRRGLWDEATEWNEGEAAECDLWTAWDR